MPPKQKYQEGDKVFCYHGPLLYEAKIFGSEIREGKVQYLIHYNGWNKNWDEWVQETRVLKLNEAGAQKQKELLKSHSAYTKKTKAAKKMEKELLKQEKNQKEKEKQAAKDKDAQSSKEKDRTSAKEKKADKEKKEKEEKEKSSTPQPSISEKRKEREKEKEKGKEKEKKDQEKEKTITAVVSQAQTPVNIESSTVSSASQAGGEPKRKRPRMDNTVESEETYLCKIEVKVKIPEDLKPVLVDDWDLITRQKMLVTVPCKQTVDDIIDDFIKSKTSKNSASNKDAMLETMLGCKDYFNVMLGSQLLYKFERPQYGEILAEYPDKPMSSIYGATHFLRLFVRLGAMLAYTSLDERTVHILLNHVHDFLKYMSKNAPTLFKTSNYEIATPDYHRKAI